jgi:hypothetical protein
VELSFVLAEGLSDAWRCDCSFCRRRQGANAAVRGGDQAVVRAGDLCVYRSGTLQAEHYACGTCGCCAHRRRSSGTSEFGANVHGLDGVEPEGHGPLPWHDGAGCHPEAPA